VPTDRECRKCARVAEYNCSMAALAAWRALTLVASIAPITEEDALSQRRAIAEMYTARTYLREMNSEAAVKLHHHGPQRAFEEFDPQMMLLVA
jgi:hypothetical protein